MKKVLLICLTVVLTLGCLTAIAFAADNANATGTYMASIPDYIEPQSANENVDNSAYTVTVSNINITEGKTLKAQVLYENTLTEENGITIPYKLVGTNGEDITNNTTILSQDGNGEAIDSATCTFGAIMKEKAKYAGVYSGTATFSFTVTDKTYTLEEIEADPYMYAIGRTKPEYVVARFNEDYSEVTIFANGEDSDGDMKGFGYYSDFSPMKEHYATLLSANIKDGVTTIGSYAFYNCSELVTVTFPETLVEIGKPKSTTDTGCAFYSCDKLNEIKLPEELKKIYYQSFRLCGLTGTLTIPGSVEYIGNEAFSSLSSIDTLILEDGIQCIGPGTSIFSNCESLTNISIPDSVTEICGRTFFGCSSLNSVFLPNSVEKLGERCFSYCTRLELVTGGEGLKEIENQCFALTSYYSNSKCLSFDLPEGLEVIGSEAFNQSLLNQGLSSVYIPSTVKEIGENAFACGINEITLSPENNYFTMVDGVLYTKDLTRIIKSPRNNTQEVIIPPASVKEADRGAFGYCQNIKTIDLSGTQLTSIKEGTFQYCTSAETIWLPEKVTQIAHLAFSHCEKMENFSLPTQLSEMEYNAFEYCYKVKEYVVPEGVTTIPERCFWDNNALTKVTFLGKITTIGENAFNGCDWLVEINLESGLTTIEDKAFNMCGMTAVTLPETVSSVGKNAFANNSYLTSITILNPTLNIDSTITNNCPNLTTVYGKTGSTAEVWASEKGYTFIPQ